MNFLGVPGDLIAKYFVKPDWLWLLFVLPPALALFFWWRERSRQQLLAQFIQARLLSALTVGISPYRRRIRFALLVLASVFLILALARPRYGYTYQEVEQSGLDIVVAIDTSKSMLAQDIAPNRLERAKLAALELMQDAASDRLGLVAFAGQAFLECPLTVDDTAFGQSVQALDVNSVSEGGTAIANAIKTAETAFREGGHSKAIVLLTDGEDNVNEAAALDAAKEAAKDGVKIFAVGIGTTEGDLIRITDADGNSDYVRDSQGNVVKTHLNETLLREISGETGGFYLPLRGADTMDTLYDRGLAPLPKAQGTERKILNYNEWFQIPLFIAILLLVAEMFLPERKGARGAMPAVQRPVHAFAGGGETVGAGGNAAGPNEVPPVIKTPAATAIVLIAFLLLPMVAAASPASALRDYNSGNFTNALEEYSQLAETRTNDMRLLFNAGDAAYRATNYDLAISLFQQVTLSPDINLQQKAYYNLGNAQFRSGQSILQPGQSDIDFDALQQAWMAAAKSYGRAWQLNTNDLDAAYNLKLVKNYVAELVELREAALRAKEAADEATRRRNYDYAVAIMDDLLKKNPTAKQFQDYAKKLKQIDDIANSHQR